MVDYDKDYHMDCDKDCDMDSHMGCYKYFDTDYCRLLMIEVLQLVGMN
jgi:hypothetical protein